MRPVQIMDQAVQKPNVCAKCGSGSQREHFVDLGIDSTFIQQTETNQIWTDGVVYLCNLCMTSLIVDYLRKHFDFINNQKRGLTVSENKFSTKIDTLQRSLQEQVDLNTQLTAQLERLKADKRVEKKVPEDEQLENDRKVKEFLKSIGIEPEKEEVIEDGTGNSDSSPVADDRSAEGADPSTDRDDSTDESDSAQQPNVVQLNLDLTDSPQS